MVVKEVMTTNPACCGPEASLRDVARLMVEHDCGEIPIIDSDEARRPVGVITDRDIVVRTLAEGRNPMELTAGDCMTKSIVTVGSGDSVEACCDLMEKHQIRRVPVVDAQGACCGIVSQADIARRVSQHAAGEVVHDVSKPSQASTRTAGA